MKLGKSIRYTNVDTQSGSSRYTVIFARSSIRVERLSFETEVSRSWWILLSEKGEDNLPWLTEFSKVI